MCAPSPIQLIITKRQEEEMTGRKTLTVPERHNQSHISFVEGCKGAAYGVGLGVVASALSFRFSPAFRALSRPMQYNMVASGGISGYMLASERAAFQYKNKALGYVDHKTMDHRAYQSYKSLPRTSRENTMRFLNDHRWTILGATWATSMLGAYGYSFNVNKHLNLKQKLFHARIYAQMITLAALMASAGLSFYVDEHDKKLLKDIPEGKLRAVLELPHVGQQKQNMI